MPVRKHLGTWLENLELNHCDEILMFEHDINLIADRKSTKVGLKSFGLKSETLFVCALAVSFQVMS
jgi:hypothetical protein